VEPLSGNRKARVPTEPAARPPSSGSPSPAVAAPAGSGIPAQLPWASRSRASRCPSGGRSESCVPCGWQHSPSSEACSCQVRPSQHQPWLVSTCSVTAHLSHRFCYPSASTQRRATHTSPAARTGPRLENDGRGPRTVGCGTGLLAAHAGVELSRRWGPSASPTQQHRLLSAGGPPLPSGSGAGVARPRRRRWRAWQEPQWRSGRGGEGSPGNDRGQAVWEAAAQGRSREDHGQTFFTRVRCSFAVGPAAAGRCTPSPRWRLLPGVESRCGYVGWWEEAAPSPGRRGLRLSVDDVPDRRRPLSGRRSCLNESASAKVAGSAFHELDEVGVQAVLVGDE
jgi:hypothetical protein